jgi:hypothetical protein
MKFRLVKVIVVSLVEMDGQFFTASIRKGANKNYKKIAKK